MARVALVTGGTRGIGLEISRGLKAAGFTVAANYTSNEDAAEAARKELGIPCVKWDVSDFTACAEGIAQIEAELGPIEVLVNNAGITWDGMLHKMSQEQWRKVIDVDLTSVFNMSRHLIEGMRERGFGRIINITSINGQKGQMGQTNYSAAKAGMIGFTKALAQETARKGITVNAVAPGYIRTDMTSQMKPEVLDSIIATIPAGRLGEAAEVASMVSYLASDEAGFITAATMTVNGAQYIAG